MMVARLEAHVERGARGRSSGFFQSHHLGMGSAGALVPAFANDGLLLYCYTTHPGVRRRCVQALFRQRQSAQHHRLVESREAHGAAYFLLFLPAFTSWTTSRKSSGVSKLRYTEAKRM